MPGGVFVTGTDTGVGKTIACACLVHAWNADYWKPAQTGLAEEAGDTATIAQLAGIGPTRLHAPRHAFAAPLSVEAAAEIEDKTVALEDFTLPMSAGPIVVEGAGGVLVPLDGSKTMADLMVHLGLPVVLVARTTLGTINHTLLSLEALRSRNISILGVILSGEASEGNRAAIARHGAVRILAELPALARLTAAAIAEVSARIPAWNTLAP